MKIFYNKVIVLFLCFLLIHCYSAVGQNMVDDAVEKAALMALYNSTDGEDWTSVNWDTAAIANYPNTSLTGVGIQGGDIVSIRLDRKNLRGAFPEEINNLTELTILSFSDNFLTGDLPNLGNLHKLEQLNLYNHGFSGIFPPWVFSLLHLKTIDLTATTNGQNSLTGPLPSQIPQLLQLETLKLSNIDLSMADAIPNAFNGLINLKELDLTNCKLQPLSLDSALVNLQNLTHLILSGNPNLVINDTLKINIVELPKLHTLNLSSNNISHLPAGFNQLPSLSSLNFYQGDYSDTLDLMSIVDTIKSMPTLTTLNLSACRITNFPSNFDELYNIQELILGYNSTLNVVSAEILGSMSSLANLSLHQCNLVTLPSSLVNSYTLRSLNVNNNDLSPPPELIKNIPNLEILNLSSNGISILPSWFGTVNMGTLETLRLDNNQLESLPENFSFLTSLKDLRISNNNLNGSWPSNFSDLDKIEYLYLNNNEIGSLPDLSSWSNLKDIRLQVNQLSGPVPTFLTNVTSLKSDVNISNNDYDGVEIGGNFAGTSGTISLGGNGFTFEDILKLKPSLGAAFPTSPQDSIDVERIVYAPLGGTLTLVAHIDTAASLNSKFQWFKYIEGGNDVPLFNVPSYAARTYSLTVNESDQFNKYYYKVTNNSASDLTLSSRLIDLIITCDVNISKVDFDSRTYLCAVNFIPDIVYPEGCRTSSYSWDFGDGNSSIDKSPIYVYPDSGTYDVTLDIQYTCGICISDTTITKSVTFVPSPPEMKDTIIQVASDIKSQVISTSAATFSDAWPLDHKLSIGSENPYAIGSAGMWRNDASYVYDVPRNISQFIDVSKDGTFDLESFNWQHAELEAVPNWTKANSITLYSSSSNELENRDVLGNYSSALYDYGEHLPSANGVNMHQKEMAFTSFEYPNQMSTGNWIFGSLPTPAYDTYKVNVGLNHIAVIEASMAELEDIEIVDVVSRELVPHFFPFRKRSNLIKDNRIICIEQYPQNPQWTMVVLRKSPNPGLWIGQIKVRNHKNPSALPVIDTVLAHSGKNSLKIVGYKTFADNLLSLDGGKRYLISAWASVGDFSLLQPKLADNIGLEVILKDKGGAVVNTLTFQPEGNIIDGWQQIKGVFTFSEGYVNLELRFRAGSKGTAWFDDLRLHPEDGNMQSYVYNIDDFRLQAILDENNYASFYYYDEEGNLYLTKKETVDGIKTITETISYMKAIE